MTHAKSNKQIPEFKTREEEAKFWDTHETTEFETEFKPVRVVFAKKLSAKANRQTKM